MTIKSTWVKAHQDEDKLQGQVLSNAALRNIDVDNIANDCLLDTRQPQTQDNAAHVDAQAISISIQGIRITGRYEDAIRAYRWILPPPLSERQTQMDGLNVVMD